MAPSRKQSHKTTIPAQLPERALTGPGRPQSLAQTVRTYVGEHGESLVRGMVEIWEDKATGRRDKIEVAKWLADRGFGKSVETAVTLEASVGAALDGMQDPDLAGFVREYLAPRIAHGQTVDGSVTGQDLAPIPPDTDA